MWCDVQEAVPGGGCGQSCKMLVRLETWPLKGQVTRWGPWGQAGDGSRDREGVSSYPEPAPRAVPDVTDSPPRRLMILSSFAVGETEVQKSVTWVMK